MNDLAPKPGPIFPALAFLTGALTFFSVNLVGNFPLAEVVLLAVAGAAALTVCLEKRLPGRFMREPLFWAFLASQALAFASYVVADIYRESLVLDIARGWSRMIFLGIDVVAIAWIYGADSRSFWWGQLGTVLGALLSVNFNGALFDDKWKFGYALPVTLAVFLVMPRFGYGLCALAVAGLGMIHLALDFRSLGGLCLVTSAFIVMQMLPRAARIHLLLPGILAGLGLIFWMRGADGNQDKSRGDRSTVERTSMLTAAWDGFCASPLIGQGSWFGKSRVLDDFVAIRSEAAKLAGVHGYAEDAMDESIAIHSQILVSITEGGIFGGAFFFFYGAMLVWALTYCVLWRAADHLNPLYILSFLLSLWNLLMSPFSGAHRVVIATCCGLVILLWNEWRASRRTTTPSAPGAPPLEMKLLPSSSP